MTKLTTRIRTVSIQLIVGLIVATALLLLLEGGLRLLPLDRWASPAPGSSTPVFIPGKGEYLGQFVTNTHFKGAMSFQSFSVAKPLGMKRIFIVGGSASLGWPGDTTSAFASYMQRAFNRFLPDQFEIINVSAMSYASFRVLDVLHDLVRYDPDYIVVWSGNNEYIEHSLLTTTSRKLKKYGVEQWLNKSSLYRSIHLLLQKMLPGLFVKSKDADITNPRIVPQVRRGKVARSSEVDRKILANYRSNLQSMAQLVNQSGAVGIFCTVPVNLSDWLPTDNLVALINEREITEKRKQRENAIKLFLSGEFLPAIDELDLLLEDVPDYSLGHYLLGKSLHSLERYEEAENQYRLARDLDPRPMRAFSVFSKSVREIANSEGMLVADLEKVFATVSDKNLSGLDLFYDYVHPNEMGHKLAAAVVLEKILQDSKYHSFDERLMTSIVQDDWQVQNPTRQEDIYYVQGLTHYNNQNYIKAEQAYLKALKVRPDYSEAAGNLGVIYAARGNFKLAKEYFLLSVQLDPGSMNNVGLVKVLYALGDMDGARLTGEKALSLGCIDADLFSLLGELEIEAGRLTNALQYYQRLAEIDPTYPELNSKLEYLFQNAGSEAIQ